VDAPNAAGVTTPAPGAPGWLKDERVSDTEPPLTHVLQRADSPTLVVGFSAVQAPTEKPKYHTVRTLRDQPYSRLFILDEHGPGEPYPQGCWYLGRDRGTEVADAVGELVASVAEEVGAEQIVSAGSSRGGFAAIYHAARNGWDHAIAGEPQWLLGQFLEGTPDVAEYIAGTRDWEWLDGVLERELSQSPHRPGIHVLVGSGTYRERHIEPLVTHLRALDYPHTVEYGDFKTHSGLVEHYPEFLLGTLARVAKR
jgi:hypothetical protein